MRNAISPRLHIATECEDEASEASSFEESKNSKNMIEFD